MPVAGRHARLAVGAALAALALTAPLSAAAEPSTPAPAHPPATIDVRLSGTAAVRVRDGRLAGAALRPVDAVLGAQSGARVRRLFGAAGAGRPALARWVRVGVPDGVDAAALARRLAALPAVATATVTPAPVRPPTPDLTAAQGYRGAATLGGIDALFAQGVAGGLGGNVRIVDVEYAWNREHEDLSKAWGDEATLTNGVPCDPWDSDDHGTAVLGELVADDNGFGVTGLAPQVRLGLVNASSSEFGSCVWNLAEGVALAADHTVPGDVILLEQQTAGPNQVDPNADEGLVPVEWNEAVRAAIADATARGRIVVEPAANGSEDLDAAVYEDPDGVNWFSRDSGAIVVGAGNAPGCTQFSGEPARGRLAFSNFGSRVDVQGWGACVTTTGYGNLWGADASEWYTSDFAGTSSASPIVAGAAAVLSSIAATRSTHLTSAGARSILKSTGQGQVFGAAGNIGPLPLLPAAIPTIPSSITGAADQLAPHEASLTGTMNPAGVPTSFRFEYGTTVAYGAVTPEVPAGTATADASTVVRVTGLAASTTYHVRLTALRDGAVVASGDDVTFTTPAEPPAGGGVTGVTGVAPATPPSSVAGVVGAGTRAPRLTRRVALARTRSALAARYGRRWRTRRNLQLRCTAVAGGFRCRATWRSGGRRYAVRAWVRVRGDRVRVTLS